MIRLFLLLAVMLASVASAQNNPEIIPLWADGAPNDNGIDPAKEVVSDGRVRSSVTAELMIYHPSKPNGVAIVACPGGGYAHLAMAHEGTDMAAWMNSMGITYCVLKYRMPNGHREVPLSDVLRAISLVRGHAGDWGVNPGKIGVMGASAGGHLAASAANLWDDTSMRPDFQILFYPVISFDPAITHAGSRDNLLGKEHTAEDIASRSMELQVTERTPQAFIMASSDDRTVPVENSLRYASALSAAKVPFALHIYPTGGHGWGFRDSFIYKRAWTGDLEAWLRNRIF